MATTLLTVPAILLKPPPRIRPFPSQFKSNPQLPFPLITKNPNFVKFSPKSSLKPLATPNSPADDPEKTPMAGIRDNIAGTLGTLKERTSSAILLGFLLASYPRAALAASGGRMGGRCFSSSSSSKNSSSSSPKRSYSSSSSSPSRSYSSSSSSPSKSYSSSSSYSSRSRSKTNRNSNYSFSSRSSSSHTSPEMSPEEAAKACAFLVLFAVSNVLFYWINSNIDRRKNSWTSPAVHRSSSDQNADKIAAPPLTPVKKNTSVAAATKKASILKLQVGLLGMARSLQKDLDKIAETADTSSPEGLSHILTETSLALLRYPDCYISTFSSVDFEQDIDDGEMHFNLLSIEERGKLDEETLVNVDNIQNQSTSRQKFESFSNEYIVVTIIVAAKGEHKLPVISSSVDLMEALHTLILLPTKKILAVEVLWTPQIENDTLSEQELLEKYPLLKSL